MHSLRRTLLIVFSSVVLVLLSVNSASAVDNREQADLWPYPYGGVSPETCISNDYALVCYHADGDRLFVQDKNADGESAAMLWHVFLNGPDRDGECINSHGSSPQPWGVCNKSFAEDQRICIRAARIDRDGNNVFHNISDRRCLDT